MNFLVSCEIFSHWLFGHLVIVSCFLLLDMINFIRYVVYTMQEEFLWDAEMIKIKAQELKSKEVNRFFTAV